MTTINQLLLKALSTDSDSEAISCLQMARKKGKTAELGVASEYNGKSAEYWYNKAQHYYTEAKNKSTEGLSREQQTALYRMYKTAEYEKLVLARQLSSLKEEKISLTNKLKITKHETRVAIFFAAVFLSISIFTMTA